MLHKYGGDFTACQLWSSDSHSSLVLRSDDDGKPGKNGSDRVPGSADGLPVPSGGQPHLCQGRRNDLSADTSHRIWASVPTGTEGLYRPGNRPQRPAKQADCGSGKGRACHERMHQQIAENEERIVRGFTPEEREQFRKFLQRAIDNVRPDCGGNHPKEETKA